MVCVFGCCCPGSHCTLKCRVSKICARVTVLQFTVDTELLHDARQALHSELHVCCWFYLQIELFSPLTINQPPHTHTDHTTIHTPKLTLVRVCACMCVFVYVCVGVCLTLWYKIWKNVAFKYARLIMFFLFCIEIIFKVKPDFQSFKDWLPVHYED